jgi:dihydropteroate synthase
MLTDSSKPILSQPKVMGILNVTPDSFSDGGQYTQIDLALRQVDEMIANGASIIDIGGESTRPGALDVSEADEISRVIPVLRAIKQRFDVSVSIDTSKASVMAEAITHNADIINDVRALQNEGCLDVMMQTDLPICLMHMQGMPRTMQTSPHYEHLIGDINTFFTERIETCSNKGIDKNRIILDPGFGFGKTMEQNFTLLAKFDEFKHFDLPLLAGLSRKSMFGALLDREVKDRVSASVASAIIAAQHGANIIRVHDVKETVDALKVLQTVNQYQ